jgi:alkanesulfonate monooxygenase SsuD/methylene tetrahydromethanopterin reductase-like flavin-dependent oxidoreductase (luciferase family)
VIIPSVVSAAWRAGRDPQAVKLVCPVFTIVGGTEAARAEWRQRARFVPH